MIERIIEPRKRPLGNGDVDRVLPIRERRNVGPFVFADVMGPDELPPGVGVDVPTHPHIGLATVTYLFDGAVLHRDSTGSVQRIEPGAVNWMTAGSGIVHSERSPVDVRARSTSLSALQTWAALPDDAEEQPPAFEHIDAADVPAHSYGGIDARVVAGTAFGLDSPIIGSSPLFYIDVRLDRFKAISLPAKIGERAVLVIEGDVTVDGVRVPVHHAAVAGRGEAMVETEETPARFVVFGGEPVGPRFIWWNFVSSSKERIEQAKADWSARRFAPVPGDDERVELP